MIYSCSQSESNEKRLPSPLKKIKVINELQGGSHKLYLVQEQDQTKYAMKYYPYKKDQICPRFKQEARFNFLNHPNIIKYIEIVPLKIDLSSGQKVSYILFEYTPYGDFSDLMMSQKFPREEMFIRTLFHQLVDGVKYLHDSDVFHMDLKVENLLLGQDLLLKIIDFDMAIMKGTNSTQIFGTENYRAPEVKQGNCINPAAADIYSLGIVLFVMITGCLPYDENIFEKGINLYDLLITENEKFWSSHSSITSTKKCNSSDLKDLIWRMVKMSPEERITLEQIRKNAWFVGPIYSKEEYFNILKQVLIIA